MSIHRMSYLACDECLTICDHSDADDAREARFLGRQAGWKRIAGRDLCPRCQGVPVCAMCRSAGVVERDGLWYCRDHR